MENKIIPRWVEVAMLEIGQKEIAGPDYNPRIVEYLKSVNMGQSNDEIASCSAFVNWVFKTIWMQGTDKPNARSWLGWGKECDPRLGAVIVMERGDKAWMGHVGFLLDWYNNKWVVLGANQNDRVGINIYANNVLGIRWPNTDEMYS